MITDKVLQEYNFEKRQFGIDEYGKTTYEDRWYYGPCIFLVKSPYNTKSFKLYEDCFVTKGDTHTTIEIDSFVNVEYEDIYTIKKVCKEWYANYNNQLKYEIENLESKRDSIMNYVFS